MWDTAQRRVASFGGYPDRWRGVLRVLGTDGWRSLPRPDGYAPAEPGFVYDSRRNRLVAFGGSSGPGRVLDETWEFDGAWHRVPVSGPSGRMAHAMVFDEARGVTFVYGGAAGGGSGGTPAVLGDTWVYDGRTWRQVQASGPGPRHGAGIAYDSRRGLVLLFGGLGEEGFLGDTWGWDGTAWRKLADTGPEPRGMGYMAFGRRRDRVVLFGGRKGWPDGDLDDTWEWDGTSWKRWTGR